MRTSQTGSKLLFVLHTFSILYRVVGFQNTMDLNIHTANSIEGGCCKINPGCWVINMKYVVKHKSAKLLMTYAVGKLEAALNISYLILKYKQPES